MDDVAQRREKKVLLLSFWAGITFVVVEFLMTLYSGSQSVLTDTVFDAIEIVVIALTIFIVPLFYVPISEKHPFGYSQLESIFILLKGFMFIAVMISLIMNNVQILLSGGNHVNHLQISLFETILTGFSIVVYLILRQMNKKFSSPTVNVEIYGWKIDIIGSIGVSLAFFIASLFHGSKIEPIIPYFDQIVAIVLGILMLPEPIKLIIAAFRNLVLLPPSDEVTEDIKLKTSEILENYPYEPVFYDITKTGRKMWISIYFKTKSEKVSFSELRKADMKLKERLSATYDNCYVELIPDVSMD